MQIWPAIDLRGGKCVRLKQGDYQQETIFGDDPGLMARRWVEAGAERLHLVDLDGARDGCRVNAQAVQAIRRAAAVPCQLGGGVRDERTIQQLLAWGIDRLVVGTRAIRDPLWFRDMCRAYPDRLVLGLDARDGCVATDGWRETSSRPATEVAEEFQNERLAAIVFTDISRDGMMQGPNFAAVRELIASVSTPVIVSGGVTTSEDVRRAAQLGAAGCIIGRTLYEGKLTIQEARLAAQA